MQMNLLLVTHDFPYGAAETFLETEISFTKEMFEKIYVLSASQSEELTRGLPDNVIPVKASRKYHRFRCTIYGMITLLRFSTFREIVESKKQGFSIKSIIKKIVIYSAIEKRLKDKVLEEQLVGQNFVAYSYWLAEGAYFLGKNCSLWKNTVSRVHSYEVWKESYTPFLKNTVDKLDKIYSIAENTTALLVDKVGERKAAKKVVLSRLGIMPQAKINYSFAEEKKIFRVITCSSIYQLKRLDLIVDILSLLGELPKPVEWIHFGGGSDEEKIRSYATEKLSGLKIKWKITGWIDNAEVLKYYSNNPIDIFLNMSDNEGIPVSIMEALSFGIPCVARDVGGNREIVNDKCGCLVSKEAKAKEIADCIKNLLLHPISRKNIQEYFNNSYSAEVNYKCFYQNVLG